MIGFLISGLATVGSRTAATAFALSMWLLSRPGGWAVLVVLVLLGLRWFPEGVPAATVPAP